VFVKHVKAEVLGHVFCSFLALSMQKHLYDLARQADPAPEWNELLRDLDRLQQVRRCASTKPPTGSCAPSRRQM
jgi:hypothetical protein